MGRKSRQERLADFVREGAVSKMKHFLKEHKRIDVNCVRLVIHKYQPLLHMACERGHENMILALLQAGADPGLLDYTQGDTAVHVALRRILSGFPQAFKPLVLLLLKYSPPDILDVPNKSGQTSRHLLKRFVSEQGMTIGHKVRSEEEDNWNEKLSGAFADDESDSLPNHSYYQGFSTENQPETFDEWADRLASEYRGKRRGKVPPESQSKSRNGKRKHSDNTGHYKAPNPEHFVNKKVRGPERKNHLVIMKLRYEKRLAAFQEIIPGTVTYDDVPWPGSTDNVEHMIAILVGGDKSNMNLEDLRKYLKSQQRVWHPDKFTQKFGKHLKEDDREKILEKVKELSQALNTAGEEKKKDEWDW